MPITNPEDYDLSWGEWKSNKYDEGKWVQMEERTNPQLENENKRLDNRNQILEAKIAILQDHNEEQSKEIKKVNTAYIELYEESVLERKKFKRLEKQLVELQGADSSASHRKLAEDINKLLRRVDADTG